MKHEWVENKVEVNGKFMLVREDPYFCENCGFTQNDPALPDNCLEQLMAERRVKWESEHS